MMANTAKSWSGPALQFNILKECTKSRCRVGKLSLPHHTLETPTFMPVGTQGTVKGLLPEQVADAGADIILGNTYHLGTRPGKEVFDSAGGLHKWMSWNRALLTDSGGFQMVSLLKLSKITEEGVTFQSPYDGSKCVLTPEESMSIQNSIGADIMMQLDDVVDVRETDYERFKEATYRTTRWLDRCIAANKNPSTQNLFPIVQGGLFPDLRAVSLEQLIARDAPGYAVGGLSGGEDKDKFWPVVALCTAVLPVNRPRYCMGVGMAPDLVVCTALGVDMFDCVYPTRTARFGCALVDTGQISLKSTVYARDFRPIDDSCSCSTCKNYTRAYLHTVAGKETVGCHLLSCHNIAYQMRLMKNIRESVKEGRFPEFVQDFLNKYYAGRGDFPNWIVNALAAVNIHVEQGDTSGEDSTQGTERRVDLDEHSVYDSASPVSVENPLKNVNISEHGVETSYINRRQSNSSSSDDVENADSMHSGFKNRAFDRGYREGLRSDYPDEEKLGRISGYKEAYMAVIQRGGCLELEHNESQRVPVKHDQEAGPSTDSPPEMIVSNGTTNGKGTESVALLDTTYALSFIDGYLSVLLLKHQENMDEGQLLRVVLIRKEIQQELAKVNEPTELMLKRATSRRFVTHGDHDFDSSDGFPVPSHSNDGNVMGDEELNCTDGGSQRCQSCVGLNSGASSEEGRSGCCQSCVESTSVVKDFLLRTREICAEFNMNLPEM